MGNHCGEFMARNAAKISFETIAEQCIAVRLRMLSRGVTKIYNQALRLYGLMVSQMNILVAVSCLEQARQQDACRAHEQNFTTSPVVDFPHCRTTIQWREQRERSNDHRNLGHMA
jgi:hypothetical protein